METASPGQDKLSFSERAVLARALRKLRLAEALEQEQYGACILHFGLKPDLRAWGVFFKRVFSLLGILLFMVGLGMFLAWNWIAMPKLLKFSIFELVFVLCSCMAVWRWKEESSACWLLGAGLGIGLLLALYGQIYQTGANAWELFRAWTLAVLPLFLLKRTAALGMLLWLTFSLWVYLYAFGGSDGSVFFDERVFIRHGNILLYQQVACWLFCEILHQLSRRMNRQIFDPLRWLTRFTGFTALALLTFCLAALLLSDFHHDSRASGPILHSRVLYMYLTFLAITYILYYKKKPDFFFLSLAVFSAALLLTVSFLRAIFMDFRLELDGLLASGPLVMALFIAAGALLLKLRRQLLQRAENPASDGPAGAEETRGLEAGKIPTLLRRWLEEHTEIEAGRISGALQEAARAEAGVQPWYIKLPMALGLWFGAILLTVFIALAMDMYSPSLASCLAFSACGVWLFRREAFAWRQLGLALIACSLFWCGLSFEGDPVAGMLAFALIFLGMWAAMQYPSAGIICMATALTCFFVFLEYQLVGYGEWRFWHTGGSEDAEALTTAGIALAVLLAAALACSLAILGTARKKIDLAALLSESAAGGALLFAMLAAAVENCLPQDLLRHFLNQIYFVFYGVPLGILCGFAFLLLKSSPGVFSRCACVPAAIFLAVIGHFSPVSALGLIVLFLARNRGDTVLAGFATAYLAAGIGCYYYNMQFPFMQKAVIMMGSGAALLALAAVSRPLLPFFAAPGNKWR